MIRRAVLTKNKAFLWRLINHDAKTVNRYSRSIFVISNFSLTTANKSTVTSKLLTQKKLLLPY